MSDCKVKKNVPLQNGTTELATFVVSFCPTKLGPNFVGTFFKNVDYKSGWFCRSSLNPDLRGYKT